MVVQVLRGCEDKEDDVLPVSVVYSEYIQEEYLHH